MNQDFFLKNRIWECFDFFGAAMCILDGYAAMFGCQVFTLIPENIQVDIGKASERRRCSAEYGEERAVQLTKVPLDSFAVLLIRNSTDT